MEPLLSGYRHQLDRIGWAFDHAHAAADTLVPGSYDLPRFFLSAGSFISFSDGVNRATLDAHAAGNAFFRINTAR